MVTKLSGVQKNSLYGLLQCVEIRTKASQELIGTVEGLLLCGEQNCQHTIEH